MACALTWHSEGPQFGAIRALLPASRHHSHERRETAISSRMDEGLENHLHPFQKNKITYKKKKKNSQSWENNAQSLVARCVVLNWMGDLWAMARGIKCSFKRGAWNCSWQGLTKVDCQGLAASLSVGELEATAAEVKYETAKNKQFQRTDIKLFMCAMRWLYIPTYKMLLGGKKQKKKKQCCWVTNIFERYKDGKRVCEEKRPKKCRQKQQPEAAADIMAYLIAFL